MRLINLSCFLFITNSTLAAPFTYFYSSETSNDAIDLTILNQPQENINSALHSSENDLSFNVSTLSSIEANHLVSSSFVESLLLNTTIQSTSTSTSTTSSPLEASPISLSYYNILSGGKRKYWEMYGCGSGNLFGSKFNTKEYAVNSLKPNKKSKINAYLSLIDTQKSYHEVDTDKPIDQAKGAQTYCSDKMESDTCILSESHNHHDTDNKIESHTMSPAYKDQTYYDCPTLSECNGNDINNFTLFDDSTPTLTAKESTFLSNFECASSTFVSIPLTSYISAISFIPLTSFIPAISYNYNYNFEITKSSSPTSSPSDASTLSNSKSTTNSIETLYISDRKETINNSFSLRSDPVLSSEPDNIKDLVSESSSQSEADNVKDYISESSSQSEFFELEDIELPQPPFYRPCIINQTLPAVTLSLSLPNVGLLNDRNKCFMISSLQALFHSNLFMNAILEHGQTFDQEKHPILHALGCLIHRMMILKKFQTFERLYAVMGVGFLKNKPLSDMNLFDGGQNDAEEFLNYFIEMIQLEESTLNISPISSLFNGSTEPILLKPAGESRNLIEPFTIHKLGIKEINTFEEAVYESIVSRVEWKPDNSQISTHITKLDLFNQLPKVLVIQFKRYRYDYVNNVAEYITKFIQFPMAFSIHRDYLVDSTSSPRYRLVSVIKHHGGSIRRGHYITDSLIGSQWMRFNDEKVSNITADLVMNDNDDKNGQQGFNAYVLLYEMIN